MTKNAPVTQSQFRTELHKVEVRLQTQIDDLRTELREFKTEMYAFREEMYAFREEMLVFQDQMAGYFEALMQEMSLVTRSSLRLESGHQDHEVRIKVLESAAA